MSIVITGASGNVGSALVRALSGADGGPGGPAGAGELAQRLAEGVRTPRR